MSNPSINAATAGTAANESRLEFHTIRMHCGHDASAVISVHILDTVDEIEQFLHNTMKRDCPNCEHSGYDNE